MVENVDEEYLIDAVKKVEIRFPYLKKKCVATKREIHLEQNDKEFCLFHSNESITLGVEASNYHLLAFSWWNNEICIHVFHGLCDGIGIAFVLRTLIYYYCLNKYNNPILPDGIRLVEDHIVEEEYINPMPLKPFDKIKSSNKKAHKNKAKQKVLKLKEQKLITTVGKQTSFKLLIRQQDIMRYCSQNDGSPATSISLMMARAIAKLHKDTKDLIVGGIPFNLRSILNAPLSHHSNISMLYLPFTDRIKEMNFETQGTIFRGKVFAESDSSVIYKKINDNIKFSNFIECIPFLSLKKKIITKLVKIAMSQATYVVSYAGQSKLGEWEKYIKGIYSEVETTKIGILIEINTCNEYFCLNFLQEWEDDTHFKAFLEELQENNISYDLQEKKPIQTAKIVIDS